MLLLFYQGSYRAPFSDVPQLNSAGFLRVGRTRKPDERPSELPALIEQQAEVTARAVDMVAIIATVRTQLAREGAERLAQSTQARREATLCRNQAKLAGLEADISSLNRRIEAEAARIAARDSEETDLIFVFHMLSEA